MTLEWVFLFTLAREALSELMRLHNYQGVDVALD
jgi:hypothetical protein